MPTLKKKIFHGPCISGKKFYHQSLGEKILIQNQFLPPRLPQKKKWLAPNCLFLSEFLKNGVCGYLKPK